MMTENGIQFGPGQKIGKFGFKAFHMAEMGAPIVRKKIIDTDRGYNVFKDSARYVSLGGSRKRNRRDVCRVRSFDLNSGRSTVAVRCHRQLRDAQHEA